MSIGVRTQAKSLVFIDLMCTPNILISKELL